MFSSGLLIMELLFFLFMPEDILIILYARNTVQGKTPCIICAYTVQKTSFIFCMLTLTLHCLKHSLHRYVKTDSQNSAIHNTKQIHVVFPVMPQGALSLLVIVKMKTVSCFPLKQSSC